MKASYLFAKEKHNPGNNNCYYCGINCDEQFSTKDYVKDTFTNRDIVAYPGSNYVCGCCMASLITGDTTKLIDGDVKTGRGGSPRYYSWILSKNGNFAFSKRHMAFAREKILNPPEPPFSIILADSGQKQLIFRTPINYDIDNYILMLEEKLIKVDTIKLKNIMDAAILCSAAIGKIALKTPDNFVNYKNIIEFYGNELPLVEWIDVYSSPLGELAAWLCPGKEEANNEGIVVSGKFSSEACGIDRSIEKASRNGRESDKNGGDQVLFDFT